MRALHLYTISWGRMDAGKSPMTLRATAGLRLVALLCRFRYLESGLTQPRCWVACRLPNATAHLDVI